MIYILRLLRLNNRGIEHYSSAFFLFFSNKMHYFCVYFTTLPQYNIQKTVRQL